MHTPRGHLPTEGVVTVNFRCKDLMQRRQEKCEGASFHTFILRTIFTRCSDEVGGDKVNTLSPSRSAS